MSEEITAEEYRTAAKVCRAEGLLTGRVESSFEQKAAQLDEEATKRIDLEKALHLGRDLAVRARQAESEGRSCTLTEHTFRVLDDAGVLGIPIAHREPAVWQTWSAVPAMTKVRDSDGDLVYKGFNGEGIHLNGKGARCCIVTPNALNSYLAPFVLADAGDAK